MSNDFEDAARVETVRIKGLSGERVGGNFFELIGGTATFKKLTDKFYEGVAKDDVLLPMYPEDDLDGAADRLRMFLEQYWGGPTTYQETRGHPRLRMRHSPFKINPLARERWLHHMKVAVDSLELPELQQAELWGYLDRAATAMLNSFED
jgi:Truncated hemoglobins